MMIAVAEPTTPDALVREHLDWALRIAAKLTSRRPNFADEAESAALMGLASAAMRFDPDGPATFRGFAARRIKGSIQDAFRSWAPSGFRRARQRKGEPIPRIIGQVGTDPESPYLLASIGGRDRPIGWELETRDELDHFLRDCPMTPDGQEDGQSAEVLARLHTRWAVAFALEEAGRDYHWRRAAERLPGLREEIVTVALVAVSQAIENYRPSDGDFRSQARPLIRRLVKDSLKGVRPEHTPVSISQKPGRKPTMIPTATTANGKPHGSTGGLLSRIDNLSRTTPTARPATEEADRKLIRALILENPGQNPAVIVDLFRARTGRETNSRLVRSIGKLGNLPLAPVIQSPKDIRRAEARNALRAQLAATGPDQEHRAPPAEDVPAAPPLPSTPPAPTPDPGEASDAAAAKAAIRIMASIRRLDDAVARKALTLALEAIA